MEVELYTEAAEILRKAREKRATLKTLIYGSKYQNIRRLFALVNECSKYKDIIEDVLSQCPGNSIVTDLAGGSADVAQVLLYEYLLGHKFGRDVIMRKQVQHYRQEIARSVEKVLQKHKAKTLAEAAQKIGGRTQIQIPRYMRVNLIKSSVEDAVRQLVSEGWDYIGKINIEEFSEQVRSLGQWQFGQDPLLFDLLVFPIGTDLHDHPLTTSGALVQQDRASCVPAHVLNPAKGSVVLDCCSAPGNKTSHLASLIDDTGRVIALDRDNKRMLTMSKLLQRSGATCVEMIVQDFLTVQPDSDDARDIKYILVDPSCSGSGMLGSRTEKSGTESDSHRLQTLKRFQILILKHALRFPNVERVVYSTCSVHPEENEEVVEEVMMQLSEYFQFWPALPEWPNSRGLGGYANSHFFLRLSPEHHLTQGFFVACFERLKPKQEQPIKNNKIHQNDEVESSREVNITMKKKLKSERVTPKQAQPNKIHQSDGIQIGIESENKSSKIKRKSVSQVKVKSKKTVELEENSSSTEICHFLHSDSKRKKKRMAKSADLESVPSSHETVNNIVCVNQRQTKNKLLYGGNTSNECDGHVYSREYTTKLESESSKIKSSKSKKKKYE